MKSLAAITATFALFAQSMGSGGTVHHAGARHLPVGTSSTTTTTLLPPTLMAQWAKVAWCEHHGNWQFEGATFDGGLGIARWNWVHFGGLQFAPAPHLATPEQQIVVARRIQAFGRVPEYVPDQQGCGDW